MKIKEILAEIERAYPEDIFRPLSEEEIDLIHSQYPGFIDRASAAMGRHLLEVIRRKLAEPEDIGEDLIRCDHRGYLALIQEGHFTGDLGSGRDRVLICLNCGRIKVSGDRDGKSFVVSFRINVSEQIEALERWIDFIDQDQQEEE